MGTTPIFAIPYVEPTDTLATFPVADKAQATALDASLGGKPFCVAWATAAQAQTNGGETAIVFSTAVQSQAGMFNASTDATRIAVAQAGTYLIVFGYSWVQVATPGGARIVVPKITASSGQPIPSFNIGAWSVCGTVTLVRSLPAGSVVGFNQYQSSGAVINTNNQAYPSLQVARLGPAL